MGGGSVTSASGAGCPELSATAPPPRSTEAHACVLGPEHLLCWNRGVTLRLLLLYGMGLLRVLCRQAVSVGISKTWITEKNALHYTDTCMAHAGLLPLLCTFPSVLYCATSLRLAISSTHAKQQGQAKHSLWSRSSQLIQTAGVVLYEMYEALYEMLYEMRLGC